MISQLGTICDNERYHLNDTCQQYPQPKSSKSRKRILSHKNLSTAYKQLLAMSSALKTNCDYLKLSGSLTISRSKADRNFHLSCITLYYDTIDIAIDEATMIPMRATSWHINIHKCACNKWRSLKVGITSCHLLNIRDVFRIRDGTFRQGWWCKKISDWFSMTISIAHMYNSIVSIKETRFIVRKLTHFPTFDFQRSHLMKYATLDAKRVFHLLLDSLMRSLLIEAILTKSWL